MDKIEVGEYVRTKQGIIGKIISEVGMEVYGKDVIERCFVINNKGKRVLLLDLQHKYYKGKENEYKVKSEDYIVKHSKKIIKLIDVGDVIVLKSDNRKYEVLKISYSPSKGEHIHIINPLRMEGGKDIFAEDIKSIVTKEQFNLVKYEERI